MVQLVNSTGCQSTSTTPGCRLGPAPAADPQHEAAIGAARHHCSRSNRKNIATPWAHSKSDPVYLWVGTTLNQAKRRTKTFKYTWINLNHTFAHIRKHCGQYWARCVHSPWPRFTSWSSELWQGLARLRKQLVSDSSAGLQWKLLKSFWTYSIHPHPTIQPFLLSKYSTVEHYLFNRSYSAIVYIM